MKNLIFFISFIAFSMSLNAQEIIKLDTDYIDYDSNTLRFYKVNKEGLLTGSKAVIDTLTKPHTVRFMVFETISKAKLFSRSSNSHNIIRVDELDDLTSKELVINLNSHDWSYSDFREIIIFSNITGSHYDIFPLRTKKPNTGRTVNKRYNAVIIQLKPAKNILLLAEKNRSYYFSSFVLGLKGAFLLGTKPLMPVASMNEMSLKIIDESKVYNRNVIGLNNYIFSENDFKDIVFEKSIFPFKYDTIYPFGSFILAQNGNEVSIYNGSLNDITPKNLRSFYLLDTNVNLEVLVENERKYLDINGMLRNEFEEQSNFTCGTLNTYKSEITNDNGFYYLNFTSEGLMTGVRNNDFKLRLFSSDTYDHVTLRNGNLVLLQDVYSEVFGKEFNHLIIARNDRGYHFIPYEIKIVSNDKGLEYSISLSRDKTEVYDQVFFDESSEFIRVKKNDLYGFYNTNIEAIYKSLDSFEGNITRFELPNGVQGWLKDDGTEFIDQ